MKIHRYLNPIIHVQNIMLQTTNKEALLVTRKAERGDSGTYTVTLRNPSGVVSGEVQVTVLGMFIPKHSYHAVVSNPL